MDITPSRNADAASNYYSSGLKTEGHYYQEEVTAYWEGEASKDKSLSLYGKKVTDAVFNALIHNRNHHTNKKLTALDKIDRRAGYDIGTSAVKSVSLVNAITKDPEIFDAHKYANRMMMLAIEKDAQVQANTQYARFTETTSNMIWASFHHFTSRPVEVRNGKEKIYASDMQLHTHNFCINASKSSTRDKFLALEIGKVYRLAPYYQALYHSYFSKRLNDIGYVVERTKDAYEIKGVSRSMIDRFSSRRMEILALAKEKGITDPKALAKLSITTRNSKGKSIGKDALYELWKARLSPQEFQALFEIKGKYSQSTPAISAKEAVQRSLDHFLERNSTAQEKRVLGYALELGYGTLLPNDVQQELSRREDILYAKDQDISIITTRDMVRAENKLIQLAVSGKGKFRPINPNYKSKLDFLNEDQKNAVKTALTSSDFVVGTQGIAGGGKTTLLSEVAKGVAQAQKKMLAIAPSSQAVQVLKQEGFDAHTVAAFLVNPKLREKLSGGVLLYDEASLSGVKSLSQVLEKAKQQKAQVILSGDIKQMGSPGEYGDAFRILQKDAKINTAHVKKNMRQQPTEYRKAVNQIASGRVLQGYQTLDKMNAVKEIPDTDERLYAIANDYLQSIKAKRSAVIVSPTNFEGKLITEIVRKQLKAKGHIKGKERSYPTLKNLSLTDSQKKDPNTYEKGQVLRFTKTQKGGFKAGSHYEVVKNDKSEIKVQDIQSKQILPLAIDRTAHFAIYQKSEIRIAAGDMIRPTENLKSKEQTRIHNGSPQKVKGFVGQDIKLENGRTLSKDSFHLKHNYVDTVHSSQGKTAQDVYISMSDASFAGVNEKAFYVGVSRGKNNIRLYTSDKDQLKIAISKSAYQTTAREVETEHQRRLFEQKQRQYHQNLTQNKQHNVTREKYKQPTRNILGGR